MERKGAVGSPQGQLENIQADIRDGQEIIISFEQVSLITIIFTNFKLPLFPIAHPSSTDSIYLPPHHPTPKQPEAHDGKKVSLNGNCPLC